MARAAIRLTVKSILVDDAESCASPVSHLTFRSRSALGRLQHGRRTGPRSEGHGCSCGTGQPLSPEQPWSVAIHLCQSHEEAGPIADDRTAADVLNRRRRAWNV
jgi:hypothetical protein